MDMVGMYSWGEGLDEKNISRSLDTLVGSGVDTLVLGGGYSPSPEVEVLYPFNPHPSRQPDRLPMILKECRARDMKLWLCVGIPYGDSLPNPEKQPDLAVRDVEGNLILTGWNGSCCPSKSKINRYYEALFEDLARRYEFDGVTLTHHRFSPPSSNVMNLFSCFCPSCVDAAGKLGYDVEAMRKGCLSLLGSLKRLEPSSVKRLSEVGFTAFDLVEALGVPEAVLDWLQFRCELVERSLKAFVEAAKSHGGSFLFGPDNYPASFALLVGHRYRELERIADFHMPLLNHPTIFVTDIFAEACRTLMEWNRGLEEEATLRLLYALFGYNDLKMPSNVARLHSRHVPIDVYEAEVPVYELTYKEAVKTKAFSSGAKPIFTVLEAHSGLKPDSVKRRVAAVKRAGVDGVAFTSFPTTDANLAAIREGLEL